MEGYQERGSNWRVLGLEKHEVSITKYKPLKGSSYIETAKSIKYNRNGLLNIQNEDDKCLLWCHVRHLNPCKRNAQWVRVADEKFAGTLNYEGVEFPVKVTSVSKIEEQNNINISVYGYSGGREYYPIHVSKGTNEDDMEVLLITNNSGKQHYILIKDFNAMLAGNTKYKGKMHHCLNCLHGCKSEEILKRHRETCPIVNGTQRTKTPKPGSKVKFENYRKQLPVPFVTYADFESVLANVNKEGEPTEKESWTKMMQEHVGCSYGYKVVCHYDDKHSRPFKSYRGVGAVRKFLESLFDEAKHCSKTLEKKFKKEMVLTMEDERKYKKSKTCHICGGVYTEQDVKVREHWHVTGKFRGVAHR